MLLGAEDRLAGRLSARRVPAEVVRKRRERLRDEARHRGEPVSARARARWTILVTGAPRDLLGLAGAPELARMRWQVERVFQLGKGHGGSDQWSASRPYKALCVAYGERSAPVVPHRTIVMGCWTRADRSPTKAAPVVGALALSLALAIRSRERLRRVLRHAAELMEIACRMGHHQGSPNAQDRILRFGSEP